MKNILFATTALVATAGFASAEVAGSGPGTINLTGYAEMGIMGGETDGDAMETQFHTDIDLTFSMSGTADNGLTFGASVDLDESIGDHNADAEDGDDGESHATRDDAEHGGASFFVSAGGATLSMGDTDGAFDKVMQEVLFAGGSLGDNEEHAGYSGNSGLDGTYDGQIARFDYVYDAFTGSLSVELDDSGDDEPVVGVGVRYSGDLSGVALGVGLGYQAVEDMSIVGLSVDAGFANGITAGINYTHGDDDGTEFTHGGIGIGYEMNALAIGVNYGHFTDDGDEIDSGFGLAAAYDLGGGLAAQLGYGHSTDHVADIDSSTWSLGLAMSF